MPSDPVSVGEGERAIAQSLADVQGCVTSLMKSLRSAGAEPDSEAMAAGHVARLHLDRLATALAAQAAQMRGADRLADYGALLRITEGHGTEEVYERVTRALREAGENLATVLVGLLRSEPTPPLDDDFFGAGWRGQIRHAIDKWRAADRAMSAGRRARAQP